MSDYLIETKQLTKIYSLATNGATLIGGLIIGNVNHVVNRLFMGILISLMVAISILPIIAIVSLSKKGYALSLHFIIQKLEQA